MASPDKNSRQANLSTRFWKDRKQKQNKKTEKRKRTKKHDALSGIRTHACIHRLRPERSALDRSAMSADTQTVFHGEQQ